MAFKDWKVLIREATGRGWQEVRHARHIILVWPATGRKVSIPTSASDVRSIKNARSQLRRLEREEV